MSEQPQGDTRMVQLIQEAINDADRGALSAFIARLHSATFTEQDLTVAKEIMNWWAGRPNALGLSTRFREAGKAASIMGDTELAGLLVAVADYLQGNVSPNVLGLVAKTLLNARIQDQA